MADDLIPSNPLLRAVANVRAQREAERPSATTEATPLVQVKTSSQVRAKLNFIPDDSTLAGLINNALSALSRGVRWARGSIINLIV